MNAKLEQSGTAGQAKAAPSKEAARRSPDLPACCALLTREEFRISYPAAYLRCFGSAHLQIRFCKAERIGSLIAGTLSIPDRKAPASKKHGLGFCLTDSKLLLIDDLSFLAPLLAKLGLQRGAEISEQPSRLLFDFLDLLIQDDMQNLLLYEEKLSEMEEQLESGPQAALEKKLLRLRRALTIFSSYYEQLADAAESLQRYAAEDGLEKDAKLFGLLSKKALRLHSMVQMLKEYSLQLREMHQAEIDLRQNKIMKVLTIVTTIFMPLTLIAGWYGMNFSHMPELTAPHGYLIVFLVCVLIAVLEIFIFRIKKWL